MSTDNVLSVSALNRQAKQLLEIHFPNLSVTGEVSNLARPSSGHWYFSLKDDQAQIRCAMFRSSAGRLRQPIKEGDQVVVKGNLSLYEHRGDYQLIVNQMNLAGEGALQAAFEALKRKLQAEGLFDPATKKSLPPHPLQVGIITSPTGAAIQDILTVLKRRVPHIEITLYPTAVQGKDAPRELQRALAQAISHNEAEVLIIGRGGGSIEDLWAFNDESLARAIAACPIPVISSVGHEIDFTICDFVADVRAPTPSAAAELVAADRNALLEQLAGIEQWLIHFAKNCIQRHSNNLLHLRKRLKHPRHLLREQTQRLDRIELDLIRAMKLSCTQNRKHFEQAASRFRQIEIQEQIQQRQEQLSERSQTLVQDMQDHIENARSSLEHQIGMLNALSPLNTLSRGYSILLDEKGKHPIHRFDEVQAGQRIRAQLQSGQLLCEVTQSSEMPLLKFNLEEST